MVRQPGEEVALSTNGRPGFLGPFTTLLHSFMDIRNGH